MHMLEMNPMPNYCTCEKVVTGMAEIHTGKSRLALAACLIFLPFLELFIGPRGEANTFLASHSKGLSRLIGNFHSNGAIQTSLPMANLLVANNLVVY